MKRERDWRAPVLLGLTVVGAAAMSFYFATPAALRQAHVPSAKPAASVPELLPLTPLPLLDVGPIPSSAGPIMAKPRVSPTGPDDKLPDPPLAIASETPPPFDLPDGGCPEGSSKGPGIGRGNGCSYLTDAGVIPHGPWEIDRGHGMIERGQMLNGERVGPWTTFAPGGRKVRELYFGHDGQMDGPEREWDESGRSTVERWYSQGALHGVEIRRDGAVEVRTRWYLGRKLGEERLVDAGSVQP